MKFGQTVTIWCFSDYCRNKKWNDDFFSLLLNEKRKRKMLKKRSHVDDEYSNNRKMSADERYSKVNYIAKYIHLKSIIYK